jgi:hypothetical protein
MPDKLTLRLDRKLIERVRRIAFDHKTSVSAWVADLVTRAVTELDDFEPARERALKMMAQPVPIKTAAALPREQAHVR